MRNYVGKIVNSHSQGVFCDSIGATARSVHFPPAGVLSRRARLSRALNVWDLRKKKKDVSSVNGLIAPCLNATERTETMRTDHLYPIHYTKRSLHSFIKEPIWSSNRNLSANRTNSHVFLLTYQMLGWMFQNVSSSSFSSPSSPL